MGIIRLLKEVMLFGITSFFCLLLAGKCINDSTIQEFCTKKWIFVWYFLVMLDILECHALRNVLECCAEVNGFIFMWQEQTIGLRDDGCLSISFDSDVVFGLK